MNNFKNKVVWITGASSGIGEALAYSFAKRGAKLILSARRKDELERVKRNCTLPEDLVLVLPLDVSDRDQLQSAASQAIRHFGGVDVLVNNAGVSHWTKVRDLSLEVIQKIMSVNFFGGAALTREVLPGMLDKRQGTIVVISSVLGKMPVRKQAAYVASKHALQGFYDTLRLEVAAEGVNVLLVCPGFVRTNVARNSLNREGTAINQSNPKIDHGLDPAYVAEEILTAIEKRKHEIVIAGRAEKSAILLKRLFPGWFSSIMQKRKLL
jgi:short-subunit dehydrogenase